MIFQAKKKNVQSSTLKIGNVNIECIDKINFHGVRTTLDEHLTWKHHINKLSNKISQ